MKTVLITGAAGFLGTYCVEKFLKEGWAIYAVDNLSTPVVDTSFFEEKKHLVFIDSDILNLSPEIFNNVDLIVHLASPVGPVGVLKHSGKMAGYILEDIYWAINMATYHDAPLIFISTSEVYGWRDKDIDLKETDEKVFVGDYKVRNEYSAAKMLAEIVLSNTAKVQNLKFQIIRPFNISGARQLKDGGFVLPTFVNQALDGDPITVFGDGTQVRSFTHVKDIVNGIYLLSICNNKYMNEIWNIGTPKNKCTIMEMAKLVKLKTGSDSPITCVDPKTIHGPLYEEAWDKIANSEKISGNLGWKANYNVDEIINDVISYYEKKKRIY